MLVTIAGILLAVATQAGVVVPTPPSTEAIATTATELPPAPVIVRRDTPLELLATKEVSTADVVAGTRFKLRLNKPVAVNEGLIIPVGTWAVGEVLIARDSGGLGKSGQMTAQLLYLEYGANRIPLEGQISARGTGAGSAGAAIIFAGVTGLFHRGNNAKIKAGEIVNAFVAEDTPLVLDPAAN